MAAAAPALLWISTAISAAGAVAQGVSAKKQADAQARQMENEAKMEANNALLASRDADLQSQAIEGERRKALAQGLTAGAASGIELNGSFADSQFDAALSFEREISMARYKGDVEGYNYRNRASSLIYGAGMQRSAGRNAMTSAGFQAVGSVASGIGNIYRK